MRKAILGFVTAMTMLVQPAGAMQHSLTLAEIFDEIIAEDARYWMIHTYDRGSVYNVHIDSPSPSGRSGIIHGYYTYNRGTRGWARVQIVNGGVNCIEFHDFAGTCRQLRRSLSWSVLGQIIREASEAN